MLMRYYDINVYKIGDLYKVVYLNRFYTDSYDKYKHTNKMIGDKFECNFIRSKSKILGYALCNDFDYFATFTLDPKKYDRYDLKSWQADFSSFIRNQRKRGYNIRYLMIPELHKDGAWHMHGLWSGIPWEELQRFDPERHPLDLCKAGYRYWQKYQDKFGYCSFAKVKNLQAASKYILKYVGKGIGSDMLDKGQHLYYCSTGLLSPELVNSGITSCILTDVDFSNEFCALSWINSSDYERLEQYL